MAIAGLISACSVPDLGPAANVERPAPSESGLAFVAPAGAWPASNWWKAYNEPQLDALVGEALSRSPDVRIAAARVRAAAGAAEQAGAATAPTIDAGARAGVEKQSYNMGFPRESVPKGLTGATRATIDLGFDLDLWGRNRAALAAATSESDAARVDAAQAQLILSTGIAQAYAELAGLFQQRDLALRAIDIRSATVGLTDKRAAIGLDSLGPRALASSRLAVARGDLLAVEERIELSRNRLAVLVGAGPDRGRAIVALPRFRLREFGLPAALSLDLMGRRPDLVAARLRAQASAARIRVARAGFYPNVNLMAFLGVQSLGLANIIAGGSTTGAAGPAISLPLFASGRLSGAYRSARADYDRTIAEYDAAIVAALREVADNAASLRALEGRRREAAEAMVSAERANAIAVQRYEGGLSTYLDTLATEDTLLDRRREDAALADRAFVLDVMLIRALGGGFTDVAYRRTVADVR